MEKHSTNQYFQVAILLQTDYIFNTNPIKISAGSFADIVKVILKFIWNSKDQKQRKQF